MTNDAKRYQGIKIKLFFLELCVTLGFLAFLQLSGLSYGIKVFAQRFASSQVIIIGIYMFILGSVHYLVTFPIEFYKGFLLEHKFALSTQRVSSWVMDKIKEAAISFVVFILFIELLYLLLRTAGGLWWLWMAFLWFLLTILFARVFPVLILPLFYKCKDLENSELKQALIDMAKRSGVKVLDVFQIDFSRKTKKANAALTGLGKSKRIILGDTLLSNFSDREIKVVLAHELGHYKHVHIWKLIAFGAVTTLINFYILFLLTSRILEALNIVSLSDVQAFPTIAFLLTVFGFITMPFHNGYTRRLEIEADRFALNSDGDKESFITCMEKLGKQNLSDTAPGRLVEFMFYDHPPIQKRIQFAKENYK